MGETGTVRGARSAGAAGAALLVAMLLTSCSGTGPGATGPVASATAGDPSAGTASAAPVPVEATPPATSAPVVASPDPVRTTEPPQAPDGRTAVVPFVTTATASGTALDVAAIVTSVAESDGTCTAVAVQEGTTRSASGPAVVAGSYTGCEQIRLADLSPGTWQLRVRYESKTAVGVSAARSVTVG